ncbi:hypothetical protein E2C01_011063 [Portunus trituberculatus]|uniref:Ionotropic glutamate receptor C-terminal domain-containing protein n=1 Tax=Portunus trituberculatus TaxID=210409 RepID=A0A5B7DAA9_PORTR|nr:hypothetical protein [Portunus trituberculatus]
MTPETPRSRTIDAIVPVGAPQSCMCESSITLLSKEGCICTARREPSPERVQQFRQGRLGTESKFWKKRVSPRTVKSNPRRKGNPVPGLASRWDSSSNALASQVSGTRNDLSTRVLEESKNRFRNRFPRIRQSLNLEPSSHIDARKNIQYEILDKFTEEDGSTPLYVTRGSISPTPSGWPIPHDAPYKAQLDRLIVAILEDLLGRSAWNQWQVTATFKLDIKKRNISINNGLSKLIPLARQVRLLSWCSMVVVVSLDPDFLVAFAEWSLKGRLLVWTTKLVVVTRLNIPQLQILLPAHWTFSMMNTVFLNIEDTADQTRFYGAKVNVTSGTYMPYWDEEEVLAADGSKTIVYRGSDYRMVDAIASVLNFTVRVLPTSSWTEVTRLVEEKTSLISPIMHGLLPERVEKFDFTYLYENAYSSFGMAKPDLESQWKSVYYPLSTGVWTAIIGHVVFFPLILWQLIRAGHGEHPNVGMGTVFQDMVGMLLGQNLPRRVSYTSSSRVLVAAWLVFALILGVAYRGNLTASLTLPKYPPRPETLKEIVNYVDMVTMPSYGKHFRKFYSESESPLFQALGSLMNFGPSLMEGLKMAMVKR